MIVKTVYCSFQPSTVMSKANIQAYQTKIQPSGHPPHSNGCGYTETKSKVISPSIDKSISLTLRCSRICSNAVSVRDLPLHALKDSHRRTTFGYCSVSLP